MRGYVKQLPQDSTPGKIRFRQTKQDYLFDWKDLKGDPEKLKVGHEVDFKDVWQSGEHWATRIKPTREQLSKAVRANPTRTRRTEQQRQTPQDRREQNRTNPGRSASGQINGASRQNQLPGRSSSNTREHDLSPETNVQSSQTQPPQPGFPAYSEATPQPRNGFVNPYNFVPLDVKPPRRQLPESHEYFVGHSGRITCELKLQTPFFTPHPERRWTVPESGSMSGLPDWVGCPRQNLDGARDHEVLGLLRDDNGRPFISGASLKGAFRSVAEAFSNSCLSILDFQWDLLGDNPLPETRIRNVAHYFSTRQVKTPDGVGKIVELPSENGTGVIKVGDKLKVFFDPPGGIIGAAPPIHGLTTRKDHDMLNATSRGYRQAGYRGRPVNIDVAQSLGSGPLDGQLKITEYIDKKKSQRFIHWPRSPRTVSFTLEQELSYNRANEEGIKEDQGKANPIPCDPARAGQRSPCHKLHPEDLVYFSEQHGQAVSLGPVEIYRVLYIHSLDAVLLRKHKPFLTCQNPESLCHCCRLFGWVPPSGQEETNTTARKGFVHFSAATIQQPPDKLQTEWVTLKPLGQPHPSCWQFYLNAQNTGASAGYNDDNATIRGRKFYWHQPGATADGAGDRRLQENSSPQPPDSQNKTVELLQPKTRDNEEVTFTFTVDFENLSDADLGLLLLTLQPNLLGANNRPSKKLYHHIGMGKPLGLGSAQVCVTDLELIGRADRYQCLRGSGRETEDKMEFIKAFVAQALREQRLPDEPEDNFVRFAQLPHVEALLILLDYANAPGLVRYPPGATNPNTKAYWESFHWFTARSQRDVMKKKRHMLLTPREIMGSTDQSPKRQYPYEPKDLTQGDSRRSQRSSGGSRNRRRGKR